MDKNTQQPVAWLKYPRKKPELMQVSLSELLPVALKNSGWVSVPLYEHPPVPRDVLVKALDDMMYHCACEWSSSDPDKMVELCRDDIERIADRYASKVQPERSGVTLEEVVSKLKVGENGDAISEAMTQATADMALGRAIREGRAKQPEPVNQQLMAALKRLLECYKMADHHDGYCCCGSPMATHDDPMNCGHCATDAGEYSAGLVIKEMEAAIAAAEAAQPVVQREATDFPAAFMTTETGRGNYKLVLSFGSITDLHDGHDRILAAIKQPQQPASAQPVAVPDDLLSAEDHRRL